MKPEQQYIDLYTQAEALLRTHSAEPLNALRARAFADFERLGFPTRRQEDCKYTDVPRAFEPNYGMNLKRLPMPVNPYEVFKCDVPNMSTSLYFVVNDAFYAATSYKLQATSETTKEPEDPVARSSSQDPVTRSSSLVARSSSQDPVTRSSSPVARSSSQDPVADKVLIGSFRDHADLVSRYLGTLADTSKDGLTAFNTAFAQDGVLLYVPRGVKVEKPIQLINILRSTVPLLVNRRLLIVLEDDAQARLLVCDHAMDEVNFLATQVIEVFVGRNATFDLYELEETHTGTTRFSNLYVRQEAGSNVLLNGMTLTGGTTRNTTRVLLAGEHASLDLCGMAIADGNQHVDNRTVVDHAVSSCTSRQLYKYVLDDRATGAFAGLVLVRPGAQHTDARQTNRNLCATRDARMYTQPQLEIYADDVKCSHGATVGQLDDQALFYMRQRGIPLHEARLLLMFAFVNEVVDAIRLDALRDRLHLLVEKRFRGELGRCRDCKMVCR